MTHKSTQPWSLHSCHGDHSSWSFVAQVTIFTMWTLPHISYLSVCLSLLIFSTPAMRTSSHFPGPAPQWDCWCCKVTPLPTPTTYCLLQQWPEQTFYCNSLLLYVTISKDCYFLFWPTRWRQTTNIVSGWLICASVFFWFWSFSNFLVRPPRWYCSNSSS